MNNIFKSKYPILEACMNKGSTLQLALALDKVGVYPSLCSWTYNKDFDLMQKELDMYVNKTGNNKIHLSFDLNELPNPDICHKIIDSYKLPTVEIIFVDYVGQKTENIDFKKLKNITKPLHDAGVKIFARICDLISNDFLNDYYIDGLCIKGSESAGYTGNWPLNKLFFAQKKITPNAYLIPYGGIGTADQVSHYLNNGAEMIAIGSLFAFSKESPFSEITKQKVIQSSSSNLTEYDHSRQTENKTISRKQNALILKKLNIFDGPNKIKSLLLGLYSDKSIGHIYIGKSVDNITEILSCQEIVNNLMGKFEIDACKPV